MLLPSLLLWYLSMSNATSGVDPPTGGLLDGYPDVDRYSCQLLGPTALVSSRPYFQHTSYSSPGRTSINGSIGDTFPGVQTA